MITWVDSPRLRLVPMADQRLVHDPSGEYSRLFWLPVVGPTALVLVQFMAASGRVEMPAEVIARSLGLAGHGQQSPLIRTLNRLRRFELTVAAGPEHWLVADAFPDLPSALRRRLPDHAQALVANRSEDR
jgi:hypothetical protein